MGNCSSHDADNDGYYTEHRGANGFKPNQNISRQAKKFEKNAQYEFEKLNVDTFEERAFGCVFGAFAADSCGSFLEFNKFPCDDKTAEECMSMPGGGYHKVAPGQITDDSELALSLMRGIVLSNKL